MPGFQPRLVTVSLVDKTCAMLWEPEMFRGWFKGIFAVRRPLDVEEEVKKYIKDRFAAGVDVIPVFDIRNHLWEKGLRRVTVRLISLYAHDLGFGIKRSGPEGRYYILPRSKK